MTLSRRLRPTPPWYAHAACRGRTSLFFAAPAEPAVARDWRERQAAALCAACDASSSCRALGRTEGEYGVWGGETERDRAAAGVPLPYATASTSRAAGRVAS